MARNSVQGLRYEHVEAISRFVSTGSRKEYPDMACILWLKRNLKLEF